MQNSVAALLVFGLFANASGQELPVASITGQPFSADEVIVENARPNVRNVVPMKTVRVYRDSAGRTRMDVSLPPDHTANPFVSIQDPVAGVHYSLDVQNKVARRLTFPPPRAKPGLDPPSLSGLLFFAGRPFSGRDNQTATESLGARLIEGFSAEGKRTTSTGAAIPGCNQNVAVNESWYSPELRMTVLQTHSNCFGDGSTRLANISRTEPDPFLFGVPTDYTIVEQEWSHSEKPVGPPVPPMPSFEFPRLPPPPVR
jgi:hypothetical protein